jgi:hypothetical protein
MAWLNITDMAANSPEYNRKYRKERQVSCYPKARELQVIKDIQQQKPGMSRSAVATYLIGEGIKKVMESKNNY